MGGGPCMIYRGTGISICGTVSHKRGFPILSGTVSVQYMYCTILVFSHYYVQQVAHFKRSFLTELVHKFCYFDLCIFFEWIIISFGPKIETIGIDRIHNCSLEYLYEYWAIIVDAGLAQKQFFPERSEHELDPYSV